MPEKKIEDVLKEKKICEIVNPKLVEAPPHTSLKDAVDIMRVNKSGYIVISHEKKVLGLFTERELMFGVLLHEKNFDQPVKDFMNPSPQVLTMQDSVGTAIDLMGRTHVYYIPLVDEKGELVNVISVRTLIRFLAAFYPNEVYNLPPSIDQISTAPEGG